MVNKALKVVRKGDLSRIDLLIYFLQTCRHLRRKKERKPYHNISVCDG